MTLIGKIRNFFCSQKSNEIENTLNWFKEATKVPTEKNKLVQIGVHLEEVSEMFAALGRKDFSIVLSEEANKFKKGEYISADIDVDRKELLDAILDQIVTAVGVAHMFGLDVVGGLKQVNASNYSKFVEGKAIFDENGKIKKGPNYKPPNLDGLY